jgi:hypothetical protein
VDELGAGERQAIALAVASGAVLSIDDRLGRVVARRLGLRVSGAVGVLVEARRRGLIPVVRPILEELRRHGYWLSDSLFDSALKLARRGMRAIRSNRVTAKDSPARSLILSAAFDPCLRSSIAEGGFP